MGHVGATIDSPTSRLYLPFRLIRESNLHQFAFSNDKQKSKIEIGYFEGKYSHQWDRKQVTGCTIERGCDTCKAADHSARLIRFVRYIDTS